MNLGSANKAYVGSLGPALTAVLLTLDERMGWGFGVEFWGAVLTVAFGLLTWAVPNFSKPVPVPDIKSGDAS